MSEKKKIFITEDEFIVSKNLASKLTTLGYEVTGTAPSGEEAIEQVRENPPDLVLMDIMLAGRLDGVETAKIIRSEFDIPIIFLTAYSSDEIYQSATQAEPYAYILKPYEERELEINISIALYKSDMERKIVQKQKELERLNENLDKLVEERTQDLLKQINERKIAQETQERFQYVIEQSSDHVLITNVEGYIEYANPAICSFTGYTADELIGKTPKVLKSGMYDESYYKDLWSTIAKADSFSDEFVNKRKDGSYYTVAQIILPVKNQEGVITHFASVSRDFSEKTRFEKKLMDIQEEERARISRELHDSIGQSVAALKMATNRVAERYSIDNGESKSIQVLCDGLTSQVREISYDLMPSVLRDYGLVSAVNKLISNLERNSRIDFFFNHSDSERMSRDIELSLFRIIQEAVSNTIKYAYATVIRIELMNEENTIHLTISDNGSGFSLDKELARGGQGLRNMKHRAHLLSGVFQIESALERGTKVKIRIPINEVEND